MGLAIFIKHDLKSRLASGKGMPEKLTLSSISEHYGVSLTPVRTAINELVEEGIFQKGSNGRLTLDLSNVASVDSVEVVERPRTADDWNLTLMKDIMLASLGWDAVYLREEALAQKHDVGRSVIRQTFNRLAGAGLLEHVARCGWLVSPLREDNMHAYLEIREVLELKALELARPHLEPDALKSMLIDNQPSGKGKRPRMDNKLHQYWIDKSGNRYIQGFFRQHVADYYTLLFEHAAPKASVVAEMAEQHCRILEALIAGHWARACHALSDHIWIQERVLSKLLERDAV